MTMTPLIHQALDRAQAPAAHPLTEALLFEPEMQLLPNGMKLYFIDRGTAELIRVEVIFRLASWNPQKPLLSSAAFRLISEGTSSRASGQIADDLDFLGSFFQVSSQADHAVLTLYSLRKHLRQSLKIVQEMLLDAIYPSGELATYQTNAVQRLKIDSEKTNFLASRKFHSALFGQDHPYGHAEQESDYLSLSQADLKEYYERFISNENAFVLLSGKVKTDDIAVVSDILGASGWRKQKLVPVNYPEVVPGSDREIFIERKDAVQSSLRIGRSLFTKRHEDYPGLQILSTVLGGYFGSRLMANIREDKGYTYGIHSSLQSDREAGFFTIGTEVGAAYTRATINEVWLEIFKLHNELIPDEELSLVRNYLTGSFQSSLENAFSYADKFKSVHLFDLDYSYYRRYFDTLRTITPVHLRDLARQYFQKAAFYTVIAGSKEV